jgi:hypothetical protein
MSSITPKAVKAVADYLLDQLQHHAQIAGDTITIALPNTTAAGRANIVTVIGQAGADFDFADGNRLQIKPRDVGLGGDSMRRDLIGQLQQMQRDPAGAAAAINERESRATTYGQFENSIKDPALKQYHQQNSEKPAATGHAKHRVADPGDRPF